MRDHGQRRPLPVRLTPAERDFYVELRRLVDAAGLSFRVLEESTSAARSDSGQSSFYSKSQWGRWLSGQSRPPRKAVRKLAEKLAEEDIEAEHLVDLWGSAFVPAGYPQDPATAAAAAGDTGRRDAPMPGQPEAVFLVGRDSEMALLTGLIREVARGRGGSVLIEGEPGIGKSALVRAAVVQAPQVSCQVFWGPATSWVRRCRCCRSWTRCKSASLRRIRGGTRSCGCCTVRSPPAAALTSRRCWPSSCWPWSPSSARCGRSSWSSMTCSGPTRPASPCGGGWRGRRRRFRCCWSG